MIVEITDSQTAPTWYDKLEFTYMPHLNIWMLVDYCKEAGSEEVKAGVDCPWTMKLEEYVWYTCEAAFKGVARRATEHPINTLSLNESYILKGQLLFIDHERDQVLERIP